MQKKKLTSSEMYKKKMKTRRITALSVLVLVIVLCLCLFTPIFGVTEISVNGNLNVAAADIIGTSGIEKGENIFRINTKKAERALKEISYVADAEVKRKFPAKVVIEITESKADVIYDMPTEFIVTTIEGRVLQKTTDVTEIPAPIVKGIAVSSAEPAGYISTENSEVTGVNLEYIKCFYDSNYWSEINIFDVTDKSNFMMIMRSGMRVTFGEIETIEGLSRKIKMLDAIIPQIKPTERSYLDLTTDKGYFGEYTAEEYENIKKLREDGGLIKELTKGEENKGADSNENLENQE